MGGSRIAVVGETIVKSHRKIRPLRNDLSEPLGDGRPEDCTIPLR